ncbi:hypothetical protein PO124_16360 [Bacillus licheniformis]|nr:hypothetical protein [Bacillus licheniformis]
MDKLHQALRRYFGYHAFKKARKRSSKRAGGTGHGGDASDRRREIAVLSAPRALLDGTVLIVSPLCL